MHGWNERNQPYLTCMAFGYQTMHFVPLVFVHIYYVQIPFVPNLNQYPRHTCIYAGIWRETYNECGLSFEKKKIAFFSHFFYCILRAEKISCFQQFFFQHPSSRNCGCCACVLFIAQEMKNAVWQSRRYVRTTQCIASHRIGYTRLLWRSVRSGGLVIMST